MLPCARFCNDLFLSQSFGKYRLGDTVVDLVCTGMVEIFALEIDPGADLLRDICRKVERRGASYIVLVVVVHLFPEPFVKAYGFVVESQLFECRHQCFGYISAPELAKVSKFIRIVRTRFGNIDI